MVRGVNYSTILPSVTSAYGGTGCSALGVSSDGHTIATATDEYINIYPSCSIWLPCISFYIPEVICPLNLSIQNKACENSECKCKRSYPAYAKPVIKPGKRRFKRRVILFATIQYLQFFGHKNEFLVGLGPYLLVIYDMSTMDLDPIIAIDMRYFGSDVVAYPHTMVASFTVLNIRRNFIYLDRSMSCIEFVFSYKPFVPTFYRVLFDEKEKWWFVDCPATSGLLPRESLDEDVPYQMYNRCYTQPVVSHYDENFEFKVDDLEDNCVYSSNGVDGQEVDVLRMSNSTLDKSLLGKYKSGSGLSSSPKRDQIKPNPIFCFNRDMTTPIKFDQNLNQDTNPFDNNSPTDLTSTALTVQDEMQLDDMETRQVKLNRYQNRNSENKLYYHPFCLLKRKVDLDWDEIRSMLKRGKIEDGVLNYTQEFVFASYVPIATIVMARFKIHNKILIKGGEITGNTVSGTSSQILTDLTVSTMCLKVHTFVPNELGTFFTILANDRFYLFKYTTPSLHHLQIVQHSVNRANTVLPVYGILCEDEIVESVMGVYYCHYDPVLKLRYTLASFNKSETQGYMAVSTNYSSQWGFQIFQLSCKSGVDALKLTMDCSRCKGFSRMAWVPHTSKLAFISRFGGEFYQLEPVPVRNWVGLISNFKSIERNVEYIEPEDIFDKKPKLKPSQSASNKHCNGVDGEVKGVYGTKFSSLRYPFFDVAFSIIGNDWVEDENQTLLCDLEPVYHSDSEEIKLLYDKFIKHINLTKAHHLKLLP